MDTILLFDYYYKKHSSWSEKGFNNGGLTIFFSDRDSISLIANDQSLTMKWKWRERYRHHMYRTNKISIEGIRIIKPTNSNYTVRIKSSKVWFKRKFHLDTLFKISKDLPAPKIFWQPIREKKSRNFICDFCPTHFELSNEEFAFKNNFHNAELIRKLNEAVRYEYHFPEGKLIRLW